MLGEGGSVLSASWEDGRGEKDQIKREKRESIDEKEEKRKEFTSC